MGSDEAGLGTFRERAYEEGRNAGWANAKNGGGELSFYVDPEFWRGVDDGVELFNAGFGPDGSKLAREAGGS